MTAEPLFKFKNVPPIISNQSGIMKFSRKHLPWRWVTAGKLAEEAVTSVMPPFTLAAHTTSRTKTLSDFKAVRNTKIYNWADLTQLSQREVTLTTKRSHHDLVFILIGEKKSSLGRTLQMLLGEETPNKRGRGRKKRAGGGHYFFKELLLRSQIMWCTRRQGI